LIERVFRERWRRVLASPVGHVGASILLRSRPGGVRDRAEAALAEAARDDRDDQRMVFSVAR